MKGFSFTIRAVMVVFVTLVLAVIILGIGMTGTAGGILRDGADNTASAGCDYQRNQFFNGNGNLEGLDERCVEQEGQELQISMDAAQENIQIIRCFNNHAESTDGSGGFVDECSGNLEDYQSGSGGDDSASVEHTPGQLYFWGSGEEDGENDILAWSGVGFDVEESLTYNYDGDSFEGRFKWENEDTRERTLRVKNINMSESRGEPITIQTTSSNSPINNPEETLIYKTLREFEDYPAIRESDKPVRALQSDGCTHFRVAVLPGSWDGENVGESALQDTTFKFCN